MPNLIRRRRRARIMRTMVESLQPGAVTSERDDGPPVSTDQMSSAATNAAEEDAAKPKTRMLRHEDMQHPLSAYADPSFADVPLDELRIDWLAHLRSRAKTLSPRTIRKYDDTLRRFMRSLQKHGEPLVMASLTPMNAGRWIRDQRTAKLSEHTIVNRLSALKAFSHTYLYRETGITTMDLLQRVRKSVPSDKPKVGLNEAEREAILSCFTDLTYHDTRDRAMIAVVMATGLRFEEMLEMTLSSYDRLHGEIVVVGKGGKTRAARLGERALKFLRAYLRDRPRTASDRLWLTEYGQPMTYHGAHGIIYRVRRKSGIKRLTWHLMRHGFAQHALVAGAHPGIVQEMLGHSSSAMTRRYLGYAKQQEAARQMPQYAPI